MLQVIYLVLATGVRMKISSLQCGKNKKCHGNRKFRFPHLKIFHQIDLRFNAVREMIDFTEFLSCRQFSKS